MHRELNDRIAQALRHSPVPLQDALADFEIVDSVDGVHVARSSDRTATLLVPLNSGPSEGSARRAAGFELIAHPRVSFSIAGGVDVRQCATLSCLDPELEEVFVILCADVISRAQGPERAWSAVLAIVEEWQRLLAPKEKLSPEMEVGLWGELWFIEQTENVDVTLQAWRGPDGDSTDFWLDGAGVEVKTSRQPRAHFVSRTQVVDQPKEADAWLLSVWVRPDPIQGRTLPELVESILERTVDQGLACRSVAAAGFRESHRHDYGTRWSAVETEWYRAEDVPTVRLVDPGVSNIRYKVLLDEGRQADPSVAERNWQRFAGSRKE